jgi:hypothetical protein
VWEWLGGSLRFWSDVVVGYGTLLGPEKTPAGAGFSWCRFWSGPLTRSCVGVVGSCGLGCGCVLSVA